MTTTVAKSKEDIEQWFNNNKHETLSFDAETGELDDKKPMFDQLKLESIAFYNGINSIHIPNVDLVRWVVPYFKDIKTLIAHNLTFDLKVLFKTGLFSNWFKVKIDGVNFYDTMIAQHLLDENIKSVGLKELSQSILKKEKVMTWEEAKKFKKTSDEWVQYCIHDVEWCWELMEYQKPLLKKENLENLFYNIEMNFILSIFDMEINGIRVDIKKVENLKVELSKKIEDLTKGMLDYLKQTSTTQTTLNGGSAIIKSNINFNSSQQLGKILFEDLKLPIIEYTPSGAPSVGSFTIERLKDKNKFVALLDKYKMNQKLISGFLEPLPNHICADGRVRPEFFNCGTLTGRLSSANPNIQQLPKVDKKSDINVRDCFITSPGYKIFTADFKAQEYRVLAHISNDKNMIDAFLSGKDFHQETADKFGVDRTRAKAINFGIAYRKGAYGFSKDWGVSEGEAQKYLDKYFNTFPGIKKAMNDCDTKINTQGWVASLTGRRRRFTKSIMGNWEGYKRADLRQAFNFCIPGTNKVYDSKEGYVPIQTLKGERILWDGESWSTGKIVYTGKKNLVNITLKNGQLFQCSKEHKIRVINTYGSESWKTPAEFSKQQYVKLNDEIPNIINHQLLPKYESKSFRLQKWQDKRQVHNFKQRSFEEIQNNFDRGLILGRLASDGGFFGGNLYWIVAEHEIEVLDRLLNILKIFNPKVRDITKPGYKKIFQISISSIALANQLKYLDIKNKVHVYFTQDKDLLMGYLKGFFDGDGGLCNGAVILTFGKRHNKTKLPLGIQEGLTLLGIRSRIGYYKESVRLRIRSSDINQFKQKVGFIKELKNNGILDTKRISVTIRRNFKVNKINFTNKKTDMYDFVNSTTGKFMTDGVIVHNCIQGASADIMRLAINNVRQESKLHPEYDIRLLATVHDELVVEAKEEYKKEVEDLLRRSFENSMKLVVPLPCDVGCGNSYGEAK